MESMIVVGVLIAVIVAYLILSRHPKITAMGWKTIIIGLTFILVHAIFDVLDTLQFDDLVVDIFNVIDGATFVIGLVLFALGIYKIAEFGAQQWGIE